MRTMGIEDPSSESQFLAAMIWRAEEARRAMS